MVDYFEPNKRNGAVFCDLYNMCAQNKVSSLQ